MFDPRFLDSNVDELCDILSGQNIDHIYGYTTLLNIGLEQSSTLHPEYKSGVYQNSILLYGNELEYMERIFKKYKNTSVFDSLVNFANNLTNKTSFQSSLKSSSLAIKTLDELFLSSGKARIVDDFFIFKSRQNSTKGISLMVDCIFDVEPNSHLIVTVHYSPGDEVNLLEFTVLQYADVNLSSGRYIKLDFDFIKIYTEEKTHQQCLIFTVLRVDIRNEEVSLESLGFTILPLSHPNTGIVEGVFQLPIFAESLNYRVFQMIKDHDPWVVAGELRKLSSKGKIAILPSSILIKVKQIDADRWLDNEDSIFLANTMFMCDAVEWTKITHETIDEMKAKGSSFQFAKSQEDIGEFISNFVQDYFEEMKAEHNDKTPAQLEMFSRSSRFNSNDTESVQS